MEFDYEQYDGIETPLENLEPSVWDRGYYCDTDEPNPKILNNLNQVKI